MMTVDFSKPRGSRDVFPPSRPRPPVWDEVPAPAQSRAYQLQQVRLVAIMQFEPPSPSLDNFFECLCILKQMLGKQHLLHPAWRKGHEALLASELRKQCCTHADSSLGAATVDADAAGSSWASRYGRARRSTGVGAASARRPGTAS